MTRTWIAVGLLTAAIAAGGFETVYVTTAAESYVQMLNEADEHMEKNEVFEAQSTAQRLDHRFENQAKVYSVLSFDSNVTEIGKDLAALRRYAQTGTTSEFLALSAQVKRKIIARSNLRIPRLENIF